MIYSYNKTNEMHDFSTLSKINLRNSASHWFYYKNILHCVTGSMVSNVFNDHNAFVLRVMQSKNSLELFVTTFISNCTVSSMSYIQT